MLPRGVPADWPCPHRGTLPFEQFNVDENLSLHCPWLARPDLRPGYKHQAALYSGGWIVAACL
jgi:hypothetical protein